MSFPFQKGFIPGSEGCFEQNFMIDATLEEARRNGNEVAVAWLDLEDAFGSIPHHHISRTLQEMSMPNALIRLIEDMYSGVSTAVEAAEGTSRAISIQRGVRQGNPLSPLLFNLALEPILRAALCKRSTTGYRLGETTISALAYADDLVIIGSSAGALHQLLHAVSAAATWSGLKFKARKCASLHLVHTWNRRKTQGSEFSIQGNQMRILGEGEQYKYLGAPKGWRINTTPTETINDIRRDLRSISASELPHGPMATPGCHPHLPASPSRLPPPHNGFTEILIREMD
ncbi:hypothetical protein J437_LFUL019126 [Ladona fulva]|uniref:Reverse transcriptase domain-containing protein n=1 Tax=Ladona fulva TaxID=123851 RepID=A0A8K0P7W5_LADFU|nr:hypothetical protein J437_LFUL019126 [Ladona fulva]